MNNQSGTSEELKASHHHHSKCEHSAESFEEVMRPFPVPFHTHNPVQVDTLQMNDCVITGPSDETWILD